MKNKLNENIITFIEYIFDTCGDYGGYSGWIHTVAQEDNFFFIAVEDCHYVKPLKQVVVKELEKLGVSYDGEIYGGHSYRLTQENYAWGVCKWLSKNEYGGEITDKQVMSMLEKNIVDLDNINWDAGDAFDITQYAMFGEAPFA
tara:strand:- start:483 stop:914 length:432 start_codon:yes stop_codon:yes gene_type:complete